MMLEPPNEENVTLKTSVLYVKQKIPGSQTILKENTVNFYHFRGFPDLGIPNNRR